MIDAFHFELGKVESMEVRQRMVDLLSRIDGELAQKVAQGIGISAPQQVMGADPRQERAHPSSQPDSIERSDALSTQNTVKDTI